MYFNPARTATLAFAVALAAMLHLPLVHAATGTESNAGRSSVGSLSAEGHTALAYASPRSGAGEAPVGRDDTGPGFLQMTSIVSKWNQIGILVIAGLLLGWLHYIRRKRT